MTLSLVRRVALDTMNKTFSTKLPSWVLLFVMLLSPVVGLADSFLAEKSMPHASSMDMSDHTSESCHDHAEPNPISAEEPLDQHQTECCDHPCGCSQNGCHSPLTAIGNIDVSFDPTVTHFDTIAASYLNPILNSQTPPPII